MRKVGRELAITVLAFIIVTAAVVLVIRLSVNVNEPQRRPAAALPQQTGDRSAAGDVTVTTLPINYGTEYLTVDICVPVISGFSDAAFEKVLNAQIYDHIKGDARAADRQGQAFYNEMIQTGYEPWMFIFVAGYDVKNNDDILSLKVRTLLDNGGTGLPHTVYYNADIASSKRLAIGDLFKGAAYREVIDGVIRGEMGKDPERYFRQNSFTGISDDTQFFIIEGKLFVAFAKYQLASGMTGEPEFVIPTEMIRELVKDEYLPLFE